MKKSVRLSELHRRIYDLDKIIHSDRGTIESKIRASNERGELQREVDALEKED